MGSTTRKEGRVARFDAEKGYGFITPDDGGQDVFVHYSAIQAEGYRSLNEGERVSFEIVPGRKPGSWAAGNVVKVAE